MLEGKTAVVVGGLGLLGKVIVEKLHQCKANVWIIDVNSTNDSVDMCDEKTRVAWFWFSQLQGNIHIWVNAHYPRNWMEHLTSYMRCTELVAQHMEKRKIPGVVVNLSSIYALIGPDDRNYAGTDMTMPAEYAAVKGGIIAYSRCLAVRYAPYGIRINCVSPGGVMDRQPESFVQAYCSRTPAGRMATPEDVAGVVAFLASDDAKYIVGQNVIVDGGYTSI